MSRAKQIAARQAELSRKKKHKGPQKLAVQEEQSAPPMANATGSSSAQPVIEVGAPPQAPAQQAPQPADRRSQPGQLTTPMARLPTRGSAPASGTSASPKRALAKLPYLGSDLRTIAIITTAMIVVLVVVAIVRG